MLQQQLKGKYGKENKRDSEKFVFDLLHILRSPIMTTPMGVGDTIPDMVKENLAIERMINFAKGEEYATDLEAMYYLSSASLNTPLSHHWSNIYFFLFRKWLLNKEGKIPKGLEFLKYKIELDNLEEIELMNLKKWIWKKQREHIKQKLKEAENENNL